ncbi:MAG: hypothetical protein ABIS86_10230 [Streptosporangiaceae bacterium]
MRLAAALTAAAVMLVATPAHAADRTLRATPGNVVVGARGGSWTTLRATGLPAWVQLIDAEMHGPHGARNYVDLNLRNVPGVWEGEVVFGHTDQPGKWRVVLKLVGENRRATGPTTAFTVKRRTTLAATGGGSRARGGLNGVLKRLLGDGHSLPYARQKVRLYRWSGHWVHTATDRTDARGRYAFRVRTGKYQIRYAGTTINAAAVSDRNAG